MNPYLSEKIKKIDEYVPNEGHYRIRLDANECPYSLPLAIAASVSRRVAEIDFNRYPDPMATKLVKGFAEAYGVDAANVVAGNGSDELISLLCTSFLSKDDKVLFLAPDFSMYAFYSALAEAEVVTVEKNAQKYVDFQALKEQIKRENIRMVIFSNPCNPTGIVYSRNTLEDFVADCGCLCVIDEAYMEFSRMPEEASVLHSIGAYPNLIVLKTLSKAFGLAALRLGFAVADRELIAGLYKTKSPYNVNAVSQAIGGAVLEHMPLIRKQTEQIIRDTDAMYEILKGEMSDLGFTTYRTDTNFNVLRYPTPAAAKAVFEALGKRGIAVRYTMRDALRITCGTEEENRQLIEALREIGVPNEL